VTFGALERAGAWQVPERMQVRVLFGSAVLDLREAVLPAGDGVAEILELASPSLGELLERGYDVRQPRLLKRRAAERLLAGDPGRGPAKRSVDHVVYDRGDELLVSQAGGEGDLGDDAVAVERGEGLDLEDDLVVALTEDEVGAGEASGQAESGDGVGGEVVDAMPAATRQGGWANHGGDLAQVFGVALDLHRAEDAAVEQDDLDLTAGHGALEQPAAGRLMVGLGREGDAGGVTEVANTHPEAAAARLDHAGPSEQAEGLTIEGAGAVEGQGGGDREAVEAEDLAGAQLVEGEGGRGRGGAGERDPTQGEQALQRTAAAQSAVGGDQAGADPRCAQLEVEGVVDIKEGGGVAQGCEGGDQILATSGVDLAIIARGEGRAAGGRGLTNRRCCCCHGRACGSRRPWACGSRRPLARDFGGFLTLDEDAKVMRAHD